MPPVVLAPVVLAPLAVAGVEDLRGRYRAAVCARLPAAWPCDQVLVRRPGETPTAATVPPPDLAQRYRLVFVPGLLADCVQQFIQPFADVMAALRQAGFVVHYIQGAGRGTAAANAQHLARQFAALGDDPRPLLVFAYSKGLPDMLELLVHEPSASHQIAALVSLAGAANGSPLVDNLQGLYRTWLAALPQKPEEKVLDPLQGAPGRLAVELAGIATPVPARPPGRLRAARSARREGAVARMTGNLIQRASGSRHQIPVTLRKMEQGHGRYAANLLLGLSACG
jgi:hypothetical protein